MVINRYACPNCNGEGVEDCCECGQETTCEDCDGDGLDHSELDVEAFLAACQHTLGGGIGRAYTSRPWVVDGEQIGVTNGKASVRYSDFVEDSE